MTELIKGLVQVRDALTLIAFLSLILLAAFRTQKVPELFFGLVRDKLTRAEFAALLRRFMTLGFTAFLVLVVLAATAQVLNHLTQPDGLTLEDLRSELAKTKASDDAKVHAEAQFKLATDQINRRDFDGAIASLQESMRAIPTLTAQEMLTYLYRDKGDKANEAAAWETAVKTARQRSDPVALARLDRSGPSGATLDPEGEHDLIGSSAPLPKAGDRYETAVKLSPGFYSCAQDAMCAPWWYTLYLRTGQDLRVKLRTPPYAGGLAGVGVFGTNGEPLTSAGNPPGMMHGNAG